MTEIYDENKPLYGSRGIDLYLKLIRQKYLHVDINKLLKYAEMEPYQVKDEGHLFSQRQINRFTYRLIELTGNQKIAREAGRFASSPEALGTLRRSLLGLFGPAKYYEILGHFANKITKASRYVALRLGPNKVEIIVTPDEGTREEPFQCDNRIGYWEALSSIYNLKPPEINHPECLFKGGNTCRYIVSWEKSPLLKLKMTRNIITVFLALLCLIIPFTTSSQTPSLSPALLFVMTYAFSITFLLSFNWYLRKKELHKLFSTIDEMSGASDQLTEQVEINYENSLLVNEISQILARVSDLDGIFTQVIKVLHNRLDYDRALVMLANPTKTRLNFQAGFGYNKEQLNILHKISFHLDKPDSKGIFAITFLNQEPQLLNDIDDVKENLTPRSYEFALKMGVKSMICCPIIYEDEPLGILAVDNIKSKRPLLQRDLNLLMGLALQIASRIHTVKLESHLRQIQKMEAVGNLAGGVAHDFNNILTTILGYSQMLSMKIKADDPLWKMADSIHHAGLKAASLTQQLLAFSRKQVLEMKVTNLNIIVEDMTRMLGRLIGEDIQLNMFLSDKTGNIRADTSQVGQVLMNLVVNARDAMQNGGRLTIETGDIYIDEQYALRHSYFKAGHYSMISVTDTGKGMSPELKDKIFEPFFTTKDPGKGTGLGLSTVYGIVKQHNGYIHVYSEPDQGTCFKIYLPKVRGKVEAMDVKHVLSMSGGSETILIVDDDDSIRDLIIDTLQPLGYLVIPASSGAEALELSRMTEQKIDLLLSDVIMPGMNGKQLADAILQEQPETKIILMSGYTDNVIAHHGVMQTNYILINKPLLPLALTSKIREVLDNTSEATNV